MKTTLWRAITIACLVLMVGCEELDYTKNKPAESDIEGLWVLSEINSMPYPPPETDPKHQPELLLSKSGTFTYRYMPRQLINSHFTTKEETGLNDGHGKWKLTQNGEGFFSHWMIELDFGEWTDGHVAIQGRHAPYKIFIGLNYEDSGTYCKFTKQ